MPIAISCYRSEITRGVVMPFMSYTHCYRSNKIMHMCKAWIMYTDCYRSRVIIDG